MFNPLVVLSKQEHDYDTNFLQESMSLHDFYLSNVSSLSKTITCCHKDFIDFQKSIFKDIIKNYSTPDYGAYDIITKKYNNFSNSIFGYLIEKYTETSKFMLKHTKSTEHQVKIVKAFFEKHQWKSLANKFYSCKGIGFRTIELPDIYTYRMNLAPYQKAWQLSEPLETDALFKKFDKCYIEKDDMSKKMYDNIEYYFKENTNYYAKEYVEIFDKMNHDMIEMLTDHKEKYQKIESFLKEVHSNSAIAYKEDVEEMKKISYLSEEERDNAVKISTYNYKVLSDSLVKMIDMITVYHRIQLKILLNSYDNYKEVIQLIYDDCYEAGAK